MTDGGKDLRVIVAGGGRVGLEATRILDGQGHDVVVVEPDPERVERISDAWVATVINGDASDPDTLAQADPGASDVVAAVTGDAATNHGICETALEANPELRTVMRITSQDERDEYDGDVDDVVFPEQEGAKVAADLVVGHAMRRLTGHAGAIEVLNVTVAEGAPATGKRLADVSFPRGSLVISDLDGDRIAGPESVLEAGEQVLVAAEDDVIDEVRQLLRG